MSFLDLVEAVRQRPVEEQIELQEILRHDLIDLRREEIYQNHLEGIALWEQGKLTPSSDVDEIMRRLEEE